MANIQPRKNKSDGKTHYRVLIRLKGFPTQTATFARKTDARRWAQQTEAAIREGRYFSQAEARKHTLSDLVERYISDVLPSYKSKERQKRSSQLRWWADEVGVYTLADVTPSLIAERRDKLANTATKTGGRRAAATVNRYLAALSHAFSMAVREWEWLESNPVRKVRRLTEPRGRVRFLSDDERTALLKACGSENLDRRLYTLVVLALSTGARKSELLSLRWPDVDLQRGLAVLHQTKNRERRAIPVTGHAKELLQELRRVRRIDSDLLFAGPRGKATFPREAWNKALRAAKIEDFRFHDLRHSAASYLAMNGATLAEIADVLGHKTLAMVKRYSHLTEQHTSKVVSRMNEQIFGRGRGD